MEEELTVLAYLQQTMAGLILACQRRLPLGQKQAVQLSWQLKPAMLAAAAQGQDGDLEGPAAYTCAPLVGASLEIIGHDTLHVRGDHPFIFTNLKVETASLKYQAAQNCL